MLLGFFCFNHFYFKAGTDQILAALEFTCQSWADSNFSCFSSSRWWSTHHLVGSAMAPSYSQPWKQEGGGCAPVDVVFHLPPLAFLIRWCKTQLLKTHERDPTGLVWWKGECSLGATLASPLSSKAEILGLSSESVWLLRFPHTPHPLQLQRTCVVNRLLFVPRFSTLRQVKKHCESTLLSLEFSLEEKAVS